MYLNIILGLWWNVFFKWSHQDAKLIDIYNYVITHIYFPSVFYSINSPDAFFATVLISPLPVIPFQKSQINLRVTLWWYVLNIPYMINMIKSSPCTNTIEYRIYENFKYMYPCLVLPETLIKLTLPLRTRHPVAMVWFSGICRGSSQTVRSYASINPLFPYR